VNTVVMSELSQAGCFLGQKSFSTRFSLFSLDFLKRHFPARTGPYKEGSRPGTWVTALRSD
jgi:hypothetical protein